MDIPIFISSSHGIKYSKIHDFEIEITPDMVFDPNESYYVAVDSISMSNIWHNIKSTYGNHQIKYSNNNGSNCNTLQLSR